ncbi:MAG TPA: hypothetical protein PKN80_02500 [bacterium]|uniref:Tetratricopeptide repeat protein n=1 Tax=candidate division TA06 bacterium ADurb.Bin417 TaxID=1852828 RepID=A0A1V5MIF2_UNCT6|nr:MAG: hypothetical protein BWY73_00577 [candidate division TA06 bacterium ADurb.Bin417]HNQ34915.1 hypothetical protein [bacterium]HNS48179.1 hypothetical protein [bacterium]
MSKTAFRSRSIAAIILLFLILSPLQDSIDLQRRRMGFERRLMLMPGQVAGNLILGGFKGLAADLLWLQVESLFHSGQHYKMLPLFQSITFLQPKFITPWAVGGWHMAYNISVKAKNEEEKQFWIKHGVDFLAEGIKNNPERYDLYFELGWTYFNKVKDYANAVKYFELAAKFPRPEYVDDVLAHAYEENGQIKEAIATWERILAGPDTPFRQIAARMLSRLKKYGTTKVETYQ